MAENTFLGLQPYTEADAYRFKGRTEEAQDLFRLIVRNDYTVCYAESGEGKTSLLNAGVFPLLRQNMYFPIAITFTSDDHEHTPDSFDAIIDRCIKDSIADYNEKYKGVNIEFKLCSTDFQDTDRLSALQQELSKYSWWKLRNYKPQAMGLTFTPVFVFDQFEEVFNLPGSIVWTKKFFDWLEDVSSDSCPEDIVNKVREIIGTNAAFPAIKEEKDFKAVFSLRKEFIGELDYWGMQKCFIPSLKDNRYCLKALTYEGAKKVMTQQQRFGEDKVEQVLRYFVQQYSRESEKTIAENLPVIPALLLSVVCDSWEKDIDFFLGKGANGIDQSLNKILERFYDEALSSIANELSQQKGNSQSEPIRENIETAIFALVDSNGKRVRRKSSELSHLDFDVKYKEILSTNRIIKISKIEGEDYIEIVHDALCPIIAKRKELYLVAEAKKQEEEILREQAKKNQKRILLLSTIILVAFTIIGVFYYQNQKIEENQWKMMENQARAVAEKSLSLVDEGDSYLARLLLLEILPEDLNYPNRPYVLEAEGALRTVYEHKSAIFRGHTSSVFSASFSPDGKRIVSASGDNTIRIWDAETGRQVGQPLEGHTRTVKSAFFSPDGKQIVSASADKTIRIWDAETGRQIGQLLEGHKDYVTLASFSPDGKRIVSASADKTIRIWDAETGQQIGQPLEGHTSSVESASFSPDGKRIVSASADNTIRIWDAETGRQVGQPLEGHTRTVKSAFFSPDGKRIVSASGDNTIRIWDAETGQQLGQPLEGHTGWVYSASFSPDGKRIVSASEDCTIRIWDAETGRQIGQPLEGHTYYVTSASFSPDGKRIVSSSVDKTVRIWDAETDRQVGQPLEGHTYYVISASFSPDGIRIVSASEDCTMRIWDAETGRQVGQPLENKSSMRSASFSPDGKRIVSASKDSTIRIWDAETGRQIGQPLEGHTDDIRSASFSPDGKRIVSASYDKTIRIWDAETGQQLGQPLEGHTDWVYSASFSPDGKRIVSASGDNTIRIWDAETGQQLGQPLEGHTGWVYSASFSPDGKRVVSASGDCTIRIWDAETGRQIGQPLEGHTRTVNSASFSPDGERIVSASTDNTVRIWDAETGRQIGQPLEGHTKWVYYASFSPDGKRIVSASGDNTVRIWDFPPLQQLIDETRERFKNRKLTPEERRKYYLE